MGNKLKHKNGKIAELLPDNNYYRVDNEHHPIAAWIIEGDDSWEKVPDEPEWQILKFKRVNTGEIWPIRESGKYSPESYVGSYTLNDMLHTTSCVDDGSFIIYTVKYKDQELSIGDYIKHNTDATIPVRQIEEMIVNEYDHLLLITKQYGKGININKVSKVEKLFTTTDAVDVYDNDQYVYTWSIAFSEHVGPDKTKPKSFHSKVLLMPDTWKLFSTKEAADKWIKEYWESKKPKKPLMVTENGVSVYDAIQLIYGLDIKEWNKYNCVQYMANIKNHKWFSTSEARADYIVMNKPVLSLQEILIISDTLGSARSWKETLINAIQKKLKENQ